MAWGRGATPPLPEKGATPLRPVQGTTALHPERARGATALRPEKTAPQPENGGCYANS